MAAACSQEAFDALVARHRQLLRLVARRFAPDRDDREDLAQEIVLSLLDRGKKALRDWRPIAPFAAYLTTIASRRGIRFAEGHSRVADRLPEALPGDGAGLFEGSRLEGAVAPLAEEPSRRFEDAERNAILHRALDQLADRDRFVLRMRFFESLDGPAIGGMLGISPGAARKAIFDATRRLRARVVAQEEMFSPQT